MARKKGAYKMNNAAKKITEAVAEAAPEIKEAVTEIAEETVAEVKETAAKAKEEVTKQVSKAKKTAAKVCEPTIETYFETADFQISANEIVELVKQAYKDEGHQVGRIKSLRTYINASERRAYYVINDKAEGKFIEF